MKFLIPNISAIRFGKKVLDNVLIKFGLERNLHREKIISKGPNSQANYILGRLVLRLRRLRDSNKNTEFWSLSNLVLRKSKYLRALALRNVRPNWYKDMRLNKVLVTLEKLNGICHRPPKTFEIKRTSIPKEDGSKRFINAPELEWRLYLWMVNYFLGIYLENKLNRYQFGHRHGRGAVDAWKKIFELFNRYENIYEFDFKGFHDNIDRKFLIKSLKNQGISDEWVIKIGNLNSGYVIGTDPDDPMRKFVGDSEWKYNHFWKGVIQGSNIAGLCGLVVLEELKVYEVANGVYIGYADDGVILTDEPSDVEKFISKLVPESGVSLKASKCGWIKKNGKLLKPLKFVGVEFDGVTAYSNTRSGKYWKMEWNNENIYKLIDQSNPYSGSSNWKTLKWDNGERYLGFLLSKVWSDEPYTNVVVRVNKTLEGFSSSLLSLIKHNHPDVDIHTASSFAYEWLLRAMKVYTRRPLRTGRSGKKNDLLSLDIGGRLNTYGEGFVVRNGDNYLIPSGYKNPCPEIVKCEDLLTDWREDIEVKKPKFREWLKYF